MAKGKGRDRRREAQWRRIIREHTRSGLTIREFCRKSKLPESAFYFWRRELQHRQADQEQRRLAPTSAPAFLAVRVLEPGEAAQGGGAVVGCLDGVVWPALFSMTAGLTAGVVVAKMVSSKSL